MFVIDVTIDIMDRKILQDDAVSYSFILCHYSHTSTVHFMRGTIAFSRNFKSPVADLNIVDDYMLCIVQKYC